MPVLSPIVDAYKQAVDCKFRKPESAVFGIVVHHTTVPANWKDMTDDQKETYHENTVNYLTKSDDKYVSAHFQISPKGKITQMVDPRTHVAYHAGTSSGYNNKTSKWHSGLNEHTIGIELIGDGNLHPYTEAQYESLAKLINVLMILFPDICPTMITGHENICTPQYRKPDPGKKFDWKKLFSKLDFIA